jgi:hypothetical protein
VSVISGAGAAQQCPHNEGEKKYDSWVMKVLLILNLKTKINFLCIPNKSFRICILIIFNIKLIEDQEKILTLMRLLTG